LFCPWHKIKFLTQLLSRNASGSFRSGDASDDPATGDALVLSGMAGRHEDGRPSRRSARGARFTHPAFFGNLRAH
jgi:hypothetical protein